MNAQNPNGYEVFAGLHEDTDKGWVWISLGKQFDSRTTIRITRKFNGKGRAVYCEYREIDSNFVMKYDRAEGTQCIYFSNHTAAKQARRADVNLNNWKNAAVINEWYRRALGGFETGKRGGGLQNLSFDTPWFPWWRDLRAACQHPEPGVRVATRIAILGAWLGVAALLFALAAADPINGWLMRHCVRYPTLTASCLSFGFAVFCISAGRGVQRPREGSL